MEEAGIPRQGGPIAVMLHEHALGRDYVRGMADNIAAYRTGEPGAAGRIAENAHGYVALLTQHIYKEDVTAQGVKTIEPQRVQRAQRFLFSAARFGLTIFFFAVFAVKFSSA